MYIQAKIQKVIFLFEFSAKPVIHIEFTDREHT